MAQFVTSSWQILICGRNIKSAGKQFRLRIIDWFSIFFRYLTASRGATYFMDLVLDELHRFQLYVLCHSLSLISSRASDLGQVIVFVSWEIGPRFSLKNSDTLHLLCHWSFAIDVRFFCLLARNSNVSSAGYTQSSVSWYKPPLVRFVRLLMSIFIM